MEKRAKYLEDVISQLPDDILVSMLSRLTIKEAASTSILSRRWEKLWTFKAGSLNFDDSKTLYDEVNETERGIFVSWVDKVLKSLQGQEIEEFRVCYPLGEQSSSEIDCWIHFAIKRGVHRVELDFGNLCNVKLYNNIVYYRFPMWALDNPSSFNPLRDLPLNFVEVSGEVLERLLYNCSFLEHPGGVKRSDSLVDLKVCGLPLKLKTVEIILCHNIKNIDISSVNLASFTYFGPSINIPFHNFPSLQKASLGCGFSNFVARNFFQFSTHFTLLKVLTADTTNKLFDPLVSSGGH